MGEQGRGGDGEREAASGITLVLGGGGARGLAHFGVAQVLEDAGIPLAMVVGNSAGALAGASLLQAESAAAATERTLEFIQSPLFRRHGLQFKIREEEDQPVSMVSRMLSGWRRSVAMHLLFRRESLFHARRLTGAIHALVDDTAFEDFAVPLKVVALDLADGEEVVLDRGEVRRAVVASCSVAGFFPPVEIEGRRVIDSGQSDNLPVQIARERGGGPVVAVNLSADIDRRPSFKTGIEIMMRSEEIGSRWNTRLRLQQADVHIAPALNGRFWLDFSRPRDVVEAGAAAAREALPRIRELLGKGAGRRSSASVSRVQPT